MEDQNPFQDPAVTQHNSNIGYTTLDLYNLVHNTTDPPPPYEAIPPSAPVQTPKSMTTPMESHIYGSYNSQPGRITAPSPPSFSSVGPCFYQDINVEISQQFQRTVTIMYYFWLFCTGTLFFNLISSVVLFCIISSSDARSGLYLSVLWVGLFPPCSFFCWYRPVYKAFRNDSSFNFFAFFFIFFAQVVVFVIMSIGIPGWGFSGWIVSISALSYSLIPSVIMMISAILFTAEIVMGVVMLKRIHNLYKQTNGSFQKAQAELATAVMSNHAVRQAVNQAVCQAVNQAVNQAVHQAIASTSASVAQGASTAP
ncbi:secretory carrier-associated membrane protein 3-like [Oreochromis niloticus]|nr:secretory carrier-associated membrane protein 3-like [Oreochromis niloticus]